MSLLDIPLQFQEFQHLNHVERCLKYTEILQKPDSIHTSDLSLLYTDLESLQGASNIRLRRLEDEIKILTEWCDKKDRMSKNELDLEFVTNVSNNKRSRATAEETTQVTSKKQKLHEPSSKAGSSKIRNKGKATGSSETNDSETVVSSKPKLTYDAPNKFWGYVEPYCSAVTQDDIKVLEDSLISKSDASEYFKVPSLGKHYSEVWAKEDFIEEQQQSSKIDKKRLTPNTEEAGKFLSMNMTNLQNDTDDVCPYGTFTQRLVAALVDENIMAPMSENELQDVVKIDNSIKSEQKSSKKSHNKSLENAIKEELFSLGLIDSMADDDHGFDADDEILAELRKCQSELKALRSHNKHSINRLVAKSKAEVKKQEMRQKAKVLDAEIVDIFRRFSSSKAKKKGFSRKDREMAWKVLRERETAWKLVETDTPVEKQETI